MIRNILGRYAFSKFNPKTDYYKILNLSSTATETDIKNSYRKLVKIYHPDVNQGNLSK